SQREYEKALTDTISKTVEYADAVILPAESVLKMTETERREYAERLRLAEQHYQAMMELHSRRDLETLGAEAPVSQAALTSARQARMYREAQRAINSALAEREAAESRHAAQLARIKADQLKHIQTALAAELRLYEEATRQLEAE